MPKIEVSQETYDKIKDQLEPQEHPTVEIGKNVMVRTYSAGVHMGILKSKKDKEVVLNNSIRIHYWDGACSLSQLAMEGTKNSSNCRFAVLVSEIILNDVIETIAVTIKAEKIIRETPSWKK